MANVKYINEKDNWVVWSFHPTHKQYRYAAACYVMSGERSIMFAAFCKLLDGFDSTKWTYYWNATSYPGQYELMIFTQDLDWQVMNRLKGDLIPQTVFRIYPNTELLASDVD